MRMCIILFCNILIINRIKKGYSRSGNSLSCEAIFFVIDMIALLAASAL